MKDPFPISRLISGYLDVSWLQEAKQAMGRAETETVRQKTLLIGIIVGLECRWSQIVIDNNLTHNLIITRRS